MTPRLLAGNGSAAGVAELPCSLGDAASQIHARTPGASARHAFQAVHAAAKAALKSLRSSGVSFKGFSGAVTLAWSVARSRSKASPQAGIKSGMLLLFGCPVGFFLGTSQAGERPPLNKTRNPPQKGTLIFPGELFGPSRNLPETRGECWRFPLPGFETQTHPFGGTRFGVFRSYFAGHVAYLDVAMHLAPKTNLDFSAFFC